MPTRRILVIGSQCELLKPSLSFLPKVAEEFYEVMIDPTLGQCVPALQSGGLLLDPTVKQTKEALRLAFESASANDDTLLFAFIGHGDHLGEDFYLLPKDAITPQLDSETAVNIVQRIKELYRVYSNIDGLILLLDTCSSGVAAASAASEWITALGGRLRFELLSAVADRPAADACFTLCLIDVIRTGLSEVPINTLRCDVLQKELEKRCPNQTPQHPTYNAQELYIARNVARRPKRGGVWEQVEQLTDSFQPLTQLAEIVAMSIDVRCVAVVGDAGSGKSAMSAALLRHDVTEGAVPPDFVHALVFVGETTTSDAVARELRSQLEISVHEFAEGLRQFELNTTAEEKTQLNQLQLLVVGPLRYRQGTSPVRIVIDGLDRLPSLAADAVQSSLDQLASSSEFQNVRIILTSRPDTPLPPASKQIPMHLATIELTVKYLNRRKVPTDWHRLIAQRSKGNWLVTRLYADYILSSPDSDEKDFPKGLTELYDLELRRARATEKEIWRKELRPVLSVLAAAGVGPVLPFTLLCNASARLGGPSRRSVVHDLLQDLRGLIARRAAGTQEEHAGVFHQTFSEYLLDPEIGTFGADANEAHEAILHAIAEMVPLNFADRERPEWRYAFAAEAAHLWALGRYEESLASLAQRESVIPAENLARWRGWYDHVAAELGRDHPEILRTRSNIAFWTGQAGDSKRGLGLCEEVLPDLERVLERDHPQTLTVKQNIALFTGQMGDFRRGLELCEEVLPDLERVLERDHPQTLTVKQNIALFTGQMGDFRRALELCEEVLPDLERVLGRDHPQTEAARGCIVNLGQALL